MKPGVNIKIFVLFITLSIGYTFSQDTVKTVPVKTVPAKDTLIKTSRFILSDYKYSYINQTDPDTVTRKRFLWYPLKTTEDIFNYLPGFYLRFMDVGQVNQLNFNQMDNFFIAVLRHGRPVNDLLDGSIDFNIFSRNEIAEIELTNGFGNTIDNYPTAVNIIQRQLFPNTPYTEISYFQDRYENLYFDGNFHQNLLRTMNFNFGITKHSYDGHYKNSDFDKWLGRFNLNFAPSRKLNFFTYVNYADIKKGLNEGVNPDTVDITNKEEIFNSTQALVVFDRAHEKKERFDIDAGAVFRPGKNLFTKLQFYQSNSFREYYQISNLSDPLSPLRRTSYHWINYGLKLIQLFNFNIFKEVGVETRSELDYSNLHIQIDEESVSPSIIMKNEKVSYLGDVSLNYRNFTAGFYLKGYTSTYYGQKLFVSYIIKPGSKFSYKLKFNKDTDIKLTALFNTSYYSGSVKLSSEKFVIGVTYYNTSYSGFGREVLTIIPEPEYSGGINTDLKLKVFKFVLSMNHNYIFRNDINKVYPENSGRADVSFDDVAFGNKLEYKIGLTSRYWTKHKAVYYYGSDNFFHDYYESYNPVSYGLKTGEIPGNFTLDFFINGRIGRAVFGLTLENILDRVIYNTGVYPFMDRGGLLNVISRFNITWNFFN